MGKSYRYDPNGDNGFVDRSAINRAKKLEKANRRAQQQEQDQVPAEEETNEAPFNVMSTINPNDWS